MRAAWRSPWRLLALGAFLSACGLFADYGDCGFEPIGASIRPPILAPAPADGVGQCGNWVDIDGRYWSESHYAFDLDVDALEPIGEANAASAHVQTLASPTIYAIPGVDPANAVAMETASGSFVVYTLGIDTLPPALCALLSPTERPNAGGCDQARPTP